MSFLIAVFLESIDINCFNKHYYNYIYEKNSTNEIMNITTDDLNKMTDTLLDYLRDKRDDLSVEINVDGALTQGFNEREIAHMIDVKDLYQNAMIVRNICAGILFISISFIIAFRPKNIFSNLQSSYIKAWLLIMAIMSSLGLYIFLDFNSFWTNFHHVFFSNDLWLLDPSVDRLIMMVPLNFFNGLVIFILVSTILTWLCGYLVINFLKRSEEK